MNIYERQANVKQLSIDNLPIRTSSPKYCQYYDKPQKNIKRCKIIVDAWESGKIHKTMTQHRAIKETPIYYYLDVESGKIDKLRAYLHHHKNAKLNNSNVFYGTKTQAIKRLKKLMA